jgi:hypothetical protein
MKNPDSSSFFRYLGKLGLLFLLLAPRVFAETVQLPYALPPGPSYVGVPFLRPALFSGKINQADSANFRVQVNSYPPIDFTTVPGWGTGPCFLEVSSAPADSSLEGERYEVDPVRTLEEKGFVVLKSSPYNTRADLPSALAGASFSIHPHWTIATLFGSATTTTLGKGWSAAASDEIRLYDPTMKSGYRAFFPCTGDAKNLPGCRLTTNRMGPEQSETVLPPGYGMILLRNRDDNLTFTVTGEPRTHAFRFPLRAGMNLLAPGHLKDFSLQGLSAVPANGFVPSSNPAGSDQVRILVGQRMEIFAFLDGTSPQWVSLQSRYSLPPEEAVIAPATKALEIRKIKADPDFVIPYVP